VNDGQRAGVGGEHLRGMPFPAECPSCGQPWDSRSELIGHRARDWAACAFRCQRCGIGFSNSSVPDERVRIVRTPQQAVPPQVHEKLDEALAKALNVRNRPSKRNAFCSARSEDAVTWTIFKGLADATRLRAALRGAGFDDDELGDQLSLLLWGVPIAGSDGASIRSALIAVSNELTETPASRSEPDVIVVTDALVMSIEAKTHSRNDRNTAAAGWPLYLGAASRFAANADEVKEAGYYELTRNWVIGNKLADSLGRDFALVNLGPQAISTSARTFEMLVATTPHRTFRHLRWATLLEAAEPLPDWLESNVAEIQAWDL
jgi:hypothetical protein